MENFIPLVLSTLLAAIVVLLHKPILNRVGKTTLPESPSATWSASALALIIGASVFLFQVLALN
jgi:hypothetical protein